MYIEITLTGLLSMRDDILHVKYHISCVKNGVENGHHKIGFNVINDVGIDLVVLQDQDCVRREDLIFVFFSRTIEL